MGCWANINLIKAFLNNPEPTYRCELIVPLDNLIWNRKLINKLFGFDYTREIYTPVNKRKFGSYILPLLYGESFIGRVEAIAERKTKVLVVKNICYEHGVMQTKKLQTALDDCFKKLAIFNGCETMDDIMIACSRHMECIIGPVGATLRSPVNKSILYEKSYK